MKRFEEVIGESRPTVVDFFATWCGPCQRQMGILENFERKMGNEVNVVKVDVDKERELTERYHIQSVPTILVFKNGEVMWRGSGVQSHTDLMVAVNSVEWR